MSRSSRSRLHAPIALAAATLVGACGGPKDLPNDQVLTSAHFRYHARADTVLDPTIMDRLETHRTEFDATYGVDPGIVDYYLFSDYADLAANSGCPVPCTGGRSVMAFVPLHEHELVHAFMADTGEPPLVVMEGIAQYAACIQPNLALPVDPAAWAATVASGAYGNESSNEALYDFGQRLVAWMRAQEGPPARFADFYHDAISTSDPALFDVQFERAWGRRLSDVAAEIDVDQYAGSFCPCTAPTVPADGSSISFAAGEEYRTLDVAQESRVEITNEGKQQVLPAACASSGGFGYDLDPQPTEPTVTVARMGAGRYLVATPGLQTGTATVHQAQSAQDDWSCEAALAAPVHVRSEQVVLWVTANRASIPNGQSDLTWFAIDLDAPHVVSLIADGTLVVCGNSCDIGFGLPGCSELSTYGDETTLVPASTGPILIGLGRSTNPAVSGSVGIRVRPAP